MYEKVPTPEELNAVTRRAFPSAGEIERRQAEAVAPLMKLLTMNAERDTVHGWSGERPVTLSGFVAATYRKADAQGGVFPKAWHLPHECAEELATDCADHFATMGGFRDKNGEPARPPSSADLLESMETGEMKLRAVSVHTTAALLTELRPPAVHAGKPWHWVRANDKPPEIWGWTGGDDYPGEPRWHLGHMIWFSAEHVAKEGYRYLGPAEWRDERAQAAVDAMMSSRHIEDLAALEDAGARIAALETENAGFKAAHAAAYKVDFARCQEIARLQGQRDLALARVDSFVRQAAAAGVRLFDDPLQMARAHDFGVPERKTEYHHRFAGFMNGHWVEYEQTNDPLVVNLLKPVAGITPGLVTMEYLEKALAPPNPWDGTFNEPIGDTTKPIDPRHITPVNPTLTEALGLITDTDPHPSNPTDEVHQEVERVIGNIAAGKVTPPARKALRGALDKAEAPPSGRAKSDAAIGRIAGVR